MKFNINTTIPEAVEDFPLGGFVYDEVGLQCIRSTGEVFITQNDKCISINEDQAVELYKHLHSTFGE